MKQGGLRTLAPPVQLDDPVSVNLNQHQQQSFFSLEGFDVTTSSALPFP